MKQLISTSVLLILFSMAIVTRLTSKTTNCKIQSEDIDQKVELPAGASARSSDGTFIAPSSTDRIIFICPGWGRSCRGSATIDGSTYTYSSSKGLFKPDIIIMN